MASEWTKQTDGDWRRPVGMHFDLQVWEGVKNGKPCWFWCVFLDGGGFYPKLADTEAQAKAAAERCMSDKIRDMLKDLPDPCP